MWAAHELDCCTDIPGDIRPNPSSSSESTDEANAACACSGRAEVEKLKTTWFLTHNETSMEGPLGEVKCPPDRSLKNGLGPSMSSEHGPRPKRLEASEETSYELSDLACGWSSD